MDRFFERYEQDHPYAICLLKSHLLAEELLEEIIASVCKNPDTAREARMSFFSKLKLAEAIDGTDTQMWNCIENLNAARNELAHGRDMAHLERKIDKLVESVRRSYTKVTFAGDRGRDLEMAVIVLNGALSRTAVEYVGG
ncbi:hypothetical protein [Lysobacter claricitrinus]|uniref:hypothetical protein n=1 Tax=Lysobacter claricitrinus TaxID=3367728 RepID=UPI0038B38AD8